MSNLVVAAKAFRARLELTEKQADAAEKKAEAAAVVADAAIRATRPK